MQNNPVETRILMMVEIEFLDTRFAFNNWTRFIESYAQAIARSSSSAMSMTFASDSSV